VNECEHKTYLNEALGIHDIRLPCPWCDKRPEKEKLLITHTHDVGDECMFCDTIHKPKKQKKLWEKLKQKHIDQFHSATDLPTASVGWGSVAKTAIEAVKEVIDEMNEDCSDKYCIEINERLDKLL